MAKLLHIALLISCAYAAASPCKDGSLDIVKGTRCRRYAECKNGSWHLKECKFGQIFDSKRVKCASVTEVGKCNDGTKCSEGRAYSYLGSTNLYYRCINGRISVQVCGTGEVFDPNLQYCRLDQSFQHSELGRAKRNADDACVEGTKKRDGKSCKGYTECIEGKEVKKTCSDCMNFDDKTLTCRFVFLSPCGDPTPAPPTTQDPPTSATPDPPVTTPDTPPTKTDPPVTTPDTPPTETDPPVTTPDTPPTETDPTVTTPDTPPTETDPTVTTPDTPQTETDPTVTTPVTTTTPVTPCKNGDKVGLVDPECKAYEECKNGVWVKDACGWFRKFDAVKKECEYTWWHKITCAK